jgi:hypothetical protein
MVAIFPVMLVVLAAAGCTWIDDDAYAARLADSGQACLTDCGLHVEEALPDVTSATMEPGTSTLRHSVLRSQEVGLVSGIGEIDHFSGTIDLLHGVTGWDGGNDSDAFSLRVPARARVSMVGDWTSPAADLDFGVWGSDGSNGWVELLSQYGPDSCLASEKPSACVSSFVLSPNTEYQLIVLGYLGEGAEPYDVSLEWLAP